MGKNILVVTGSPRKNGNTSMLADAFIEAALANGHKVARFDAGLKKLSGCKACDTCFSTGHACSVNDDFRELEPLLQGVDVVVWATPLYWFNMSAQIKAVMDRFYAFGSKKMLDDIKESLFLVCAETDDGDDFSGLRETHRLICSYLKWADLGVFTVPKVWHKGDILKTDALERVRALVAELF